MVRSRGRGGFGPGMVSRAVGVRTAWRAIDDGEFFCTGCGGDRSYQLLAGRRRLTVLGVPVLSRGPADPAVACGSCRGHYPVSDLDEPTTTRLSALLRDAVHTVALTMLGAGGGGQAAAWRAAAASVRAAGYPDCTEERLLTLRAALWAQRAPGALPLDGESREVLASLAPHLSAPGRESLVLHGARVALADGPYLPDEREALAEIGAALGLAPADTERLLLAAATPS